MVTIKIETINDAFREDCGAELARILRTIADKYASGAYADGPIRDSNGNKVGTVEDDD